MPAASRKSRKPAVISTPRKKVRDLEKRLLALRNDEQARFLSGFFKTGPGQYAEGDRFLGIRVPVVRSLVREFRGLSSKDSLKLVRSKYHEIRLAGLLLWVAAFETGDDVTRKNIFRAYLENTRFINNWDLVDLTAPAIAGGSVPAEDTRLLAKMARSPVLWERRIAVLATHHYIRQSNFEPTLVLCEMLLADPHDLMHKACGWTLREVGKRDRAVLSRFLDRFAAVMPRTMLRYALEHYPGPQRLYYLSLRGSSSSSISR